MSLTTVTEPQPSLAWTFESSNVDVVTGLSPSAQNSPGPAQLQGSAALVTNAPAGSNTAVYFPNLLNSYMNLGTSTPINFDYSTSNLFVEAWIYIPTLQNANMVTFHDTVPRRGKEYWTMYVDSLGFLIVNLWGVNAGADQFFARNQGTVSAQTWTHVYFSVSYNPSTLLYTLATGINGTVTSGTSPSGWTANTSYATGSTYIGGGGVYTTNMYIRDLRVVQGGVVPTTSFTPSAAPFSYASPTYVTGGTTVFTLLGQFITYNPNGKYGNSFMMAPNLSMIFSGNIPNYSSSQGISVSLWWYGMNTGGYLLDLSSVTSGSVTRDRLWVLVDSNGKLVAQLPFLYTWSAPISSIGVWNHLTFIATNTSYSVYYNGAFQQTFTISFPSIDYYGTNLSIGNLINSTQTACNGLIDDLRIYNTALTAAQVQSIYTQGGAPASGFRVMPQPSFAWSFDGTTTDYVSGLVPANYGGASANAITYANAAIYAPGKYGQSINVYNTSNTFYLNTLQYRLPSAIGPPYSISFWAKQNTAWVPGNGSFRSLCLRNVSVPVNSFIFKLTGDLYLNASILDANNNGTDFPFILNGPIGNWFFVCLSVLPQTATLYFWSPSYTSVQSKTVTTANTWATCGTDIATGVSGYVETNTTNQPFNGLIDDLRIYSSALSSAQVQSVYNQQGVPGRGVQVKTQVPVASRTTTTTFLNPSNYSINLGTQYLTPSITGLTVSTVFRILNSGTGFGGIFTIIDNPFTPSTSNLFVLQTNNSETSYTAATWVNGSGKASTNQTGYTTQTDYYITVVIQPNGSFSFYQNGTLVTTATSGATPLPNKNYSIYLGTSHFNTSIWNYGMTMYDFFVVNAALNASQVAQLYQNQLANINYNPGNSFNWTPSRASGTPLFSQLSASAVSSAVGAFSLRAVNGTTAKAVRIIRQSDLAQQDFYADRLGNLLTAPVTGQTLASWLGNSTGNVVTWYDQSGKGNDAKQTTAANQPVIQRATKGPGYSALFNGTSTIMTLGSGANLDGTNYSVCVGSRRNKSGEMYYVGTNGPSSTRQQLSTGYYTDTSTIINEYAYALVSVAVPGYIASEPMGYDFYMFSQTNGMYIYNWRTGTSYASGNSGLTTPMSSSGSITIGFSAWNGSNKYFSGEIYEVLIMTTSLFDLSGSTPGTYTTPPSIIQTIYQNQLNYTGT